MVGLLLPLTMLGAGTARADRPASVAAQSAPVFQWKIPKSGHIGAWAASKGVLSYDGSGPGRVAATFSVAGMQDFSVQAQMRTPGPGQTFAEVGGFGVLVEQKNPDPSTWVQAGSFFGSTGENTNPDIFWNGQSVGGVALDPKTAWHTYRLDVHGQQYSLAIDGKPMVMATLPDKITPYRVGIFALYYRASMRNFTVSKLGPATAQPALDVAARNANLNLADLPTTGFYQPYLRHWYTAAETARERGMSEAAVQATGRIDSYAEEFYARSREVDDIYSSIETFGTPAQARQEVALRMSLARQAVPEHTYYADLTGLGVGDVSDGYRVDISSSVGPVRLIIVCASRGRFTFLLRTVFDVTLSPDPNQNLAFVLNMAHIIDGRLAAARQ